MKQFLILLSILPFLSFSQEKTPEFSSYEEHFYYKFATESNEKLLIFLHGGVNNPYFEKEPQEVDVNYLIEENATFINESHKNGFDLILPIIDDSMNWLTNADKTFEILQKIIESQNKDYKEIVLSGHSDGGSGSYKIFYSHADFFDGVVMFNGYPQHNNFAKKIDHSNVTNKKVVFYATFKDETIPYEFSLSEYCKQKKFNPNTFLFVREGNHNFSNYEQNDFVQLFKILDSSIKNTKVETNPIHGFTVNDELVKFYPYRKIIVRKFAYGKNLWEENKRQLKLYNIN